MKPGDIVYSAHVSTAHGSVKLCDFISHMTMIQDWTRLTAKISFATNVYVLGPLGGLWNCWLSPGCTVEVQR